MGRVASITYKPIGSGEGGDGYVRVPIQEAQLVAGHGIEGDEKGGVAERHLNILSIESVSPLEQYGFNVAPGAFGEQIVVEGVGIDGLEPGARVKIGATAVVRMVKARNGCAKLERNQGMPKDATAGRLGMMAEVEEGGAIRLGDAVEVIEG